MEAVPWVGGMTTILLLLFIFCFNHHFFFPAQVVGGRTLGDLRTSRDHRCRPFPPVRALIFCRSIPTAR